jgi:hypothetical protein
LGQAMRAGAGFGAAAQLGAALRQNAMTIQDTTPTLRVRPA